MKLAYIIVAFLVLLQGTATVTLWSLNPTDAASQALFGILLGIDLLAFALVSYLYRTEKAGTAFDRGWILAGCCVFIVLLVVVLVQA